MRKLSCHAKILCMRARQIAPIALILVGVVGCTSGGSGGTTSGPTSAVPARTPAPVTTSPTAPSTSTSPTPTVATTGPNIRPGEKPPALTAGAKMHSAAGALAFTIVWVRALDWGYATTDSTLARELFLPSCTQCERFANIFDSAKAAQEHFKGGRLSLKSTSLVTDNQHPGARSVDFVFGQQAVERIDATGMTIRTSPSHATTTYRLWAEWRINTWKIVDLKQVVYK